MRKSAVIAVALVLVAALASAQMKTNRSSGTTPNRTGRSPLIASGAAQRPVAGFPRISREDAYKLYSEGKAVFIDVRSNESFLTGHIKGALSIPGSQLIARFREVPPKKAIIAYCACDAEQSSGRAVQNLMAHGVKNAYALKGGWHEWKDNRLPIAAGPK